MVFHVYRDKRKEWRWRCVSRNGKIVADSGEGYTRRDNCLRMLGSFVVYITNHSYTIKIHPWQEAFHV